MMRSYIKESTGDVVDKDDIAKLGQRYGRELVNMSDGDAAAVKLQHDRCLKMICMADESRVPRYHLMGSKVMAFRPRPDDQAAAVALSALAQALTSSGCRKSCPEGCDDTHSKVTFIWCFPTGPL